MSRPSEPIWRRYLRFHRDDARADLDDEIRDHLASAEDALRARGLTPDRAREEAHRRFGDLARVRDAVAHIDHQHSRRTRYLDLMDTLWQDIRYAVRAFARTPGLTLVATVSIALAIAANSAVFSIVNAVLLRPIPGVASDRLVRVYANHHSPFAWRELSWFRDRTTSFDAMIGERYGAMSFRPAASDRLERVRTSLVTRGYFAALGVQPVRGRFFDGDETTADGAQSLVVVSYEFWRQRLGADSGVVGRVINLSGHPVAITAIAPQGFRSSVVGWTPEIFVPLAIAPMLTGTKLEEFGGSLYTTARLRPGVSREMAAAELDVLMSQLARTDSARYERQSVRLDHTRGVNAELRGAGVAASAFAMGMVLVVLLIACANVANLLLGRAAARHTEIGVRLAMGASRARIVRQLLTESFLLAMLGTLLGFAVSLLLTRALARAVPAEAGIDAMFFAPDRRVLMFTCVLCVTTTLLFGLFPALRSASPNLSTLIKGDVQSSGKRRRRGGLIMAQVALCLLTIATAALFWRSLDKIRGVDSGFDPRGVIDVALDLDLLNVDESSRQRIFARILDASAALPNVRSATLAALVPLSGSNMETRVGPSGRTFETRFDLPSTYFNVVSPGYFETLRLPLRTGRAFIESDRDGAPLVAVVNETAAARWWPGESAVGKRFKWGASDGSDIEVVGVARDADYNMPGESRNAFVYVPLAQQARGEMVLQLRTDTDIGALREEVWSLVRAEAPSLPPPPITRMQDDMATTLLPVRAGGWLLGALGLIAVALAIAGIYGVAAYAVARRQRELGIRAALGAERARLLRMILGESLRPVSVGIGIGLVLTIAVAFGLSRVLYGVQAVDPIVLPIVSALLIAVAVGATWVPGWRAASVEPTIAIRSE